MSELVQSFGDSTEPMVVLDGVSKVFGNGPKAVVAVDNVSLSINRGEIFAIIGYSGAGKSTLVRLINGLETTTSGTLTVGGFEISGKRDSELREARTNIGMIFQQFNLMNSRTVLGNVEFPLKIAGWSKEGPPRPRPGNARVRGSCRPCRPLPEPAFGRSEAACGYCPCARDQPRTAAGGRVHQRAGSGNHS